MQNESDNFEAKKIEATQIEATNLKQQMLKLSLREEQMFSMDRPLILEVIK